MGRDHRGAGDSGDVIVAVVDTGVLLSHPDLAGKLVAGYDFIIDPVAARDGGGSDIEPGRSRHLSERRPEQLARHARRRHHRGGVEQRHRRRGRLLGREDHAAARPRPERERDERRHHQGCPLGGGTRQRRRPPRRGRPARAGVINLSLGGRGNSATEQAVYDQVRAAGVIVVAAAGNNGKNELFYPASYNGVISVSAVDMLGQRAPYSNFRSTGGRGGAGRRHVRRRWTGTASRTAS